MKISVKMELDAEHHFTSLNFYSIFHWKATADQISATDSVYSLQLGKEQMEGKFQVPDATRYLRSHAAEHRESWAGNLLAEEINGGCCGALKIECRRCCLQLLWHVLVKWYKNMVTALQFCTTCTSKLKNMEQAEHFSLAVFILWQAEQSILLWTDMAEKNQRGGQG